MIDDHGIMLDCALVDRGLQCSPGQETLHDDELVTDFFPQKTIRQGLDTVVLHSDTYCMWTLALFP